MDASLVVLPAAVGAAAAAQQYLKAGLLDEIHVNLVPVLLGGGVL
jgi:dihydrofolate reductase